MRARTNVVSVTLPIFKRTPDRGRLSRFQNTLILGQHGLELLEPFKIYRCLNIKAISAHPNSQRRTSGRVGIIDSPQPCRRARIVSKLGLHWAS
jgi:hypothetical protein